MKRQEVQHQLLSRGLKVNDIASHSARKGAATYVSSGSTACPPHAAITLRAGWSMPGVQDTYIRYEAAGDMFVGRTVAGLPINSPDFAVLPPHFFQNDHELVKSSVALCFPGAPPEIQELLAMCLASLCYHTEYLRSKLSSSHKLWNTPLYSQDLVTRLQPLVVTGRVRDDNANMLATGLPPHIELLLAMTKAADEIKQVIPAIDAAVPKIIGGVSQVLEDKGIEAGTVTRDGLKEMLHKVLDDAGVFAARDDIRAIVPAAQHPQLPVVPHQVYMWGGAFHPVPQDFALPDCNTLSAWQLYVCGDRSKGYPPFRFLQPPDMSTKNLRKRLSDFKFLMQVLEKKVKVLEKWIATPSLEQANEMFVAASPVLESAFRKTQRSSQLQWSTVVNKVRADLRAQQ